MTPPGVGDADIDLSVSPVSVSIPVSAHICYLEVEVLWDSFETVPSPAPPSPALWEPRPGQVGLAGAGLRCSRAEKWCPAVAAAVAGHAAGERGAFRGA